MIHGTKNGIMAFFESISKIRRAFEANYAIDGQIWDEFLWSCTIFSRYAFYGGRGLRYVPLRVANFLQGNVLLINLV